MMTSSSRLVLSACLLAVLTTAPVVAQQRFVEGILGIGGAIVLNELSKSNNRQQAAPRPVQVDPAAAQRAAEQREQTRLVQTRLNALGFDAGTPDGLSGPKTRNAISQFQVSIGAAPTGALSAEQIAVLYEQSSGFGDGPLPAGGFPSLGTASTAPVTPPTAFPALGGPAANPGAAAAFPALGTPGVPQAPAGQFPALATPEAPLGVAAFPTIAAPATPAAPVAPLVAGSATASQAKPVQTSLADEVAATPFASLDAQPQVLGISLGSSPEAFAAMLEENGFGNCVAGAQSNQCVRQTATLTDTLKGWSAADGIWAIARLIQFTEPVPADFVQQQFNQTYPDLMAAEGGLISSGEACTIVGTAVPQLAAVLDQRNDGDGAGEVPADLLAVANACPVAYSLAFNEGNGLVAAVQVLLFDGTSVIRQHLASNNARESQIGADLKF